MRILIISPYYAPHIVGGAEISCQLLAEGINSLDRGITVEILTIGKSNGSYIHNSVRVNTIWPSGVLYRDFVRVLKTSQKKMFDKIIGFCYSILPRNRLYKKYQEFISNGQYDVIIMNSNEESFGRASLWKAVSKAGGVSILVFRDPMLLEKKIGRFKFDWLYKDIVLKQSRNLTAFVAPSHYMLNLYQRNGFKRENGKVIYNSVDIELNLPSKKKKQIIYAGAITQNKGILTLLKAMKYVNINQHCAIKLLLVGRGNLVSLVQQYDFVEHIDWVSREILYKYISESIALILPSEWPEAFGRTLVEAVFSGTLPIGSNAAAIPEVLDYDERYIFHEKNYHELTDKINRIINLNDMDYKNELCDIQTKFIKYSKETYISNWIEYINKLVCEY